MSISFTGSELINIAIDIEKSGIAFYDIMTRSTESDEARNAFKFLAAMERHHVDVFQGMLGKAAKYQSAGTYTEEYAGYVRSLVDSAVFSDEMLNGELVNKVNSDIDAIELAIGAEKDSILFYYEMKEIMPEQARPVVTEIIAEEKGHLRQLSELKKRLTAH